MTVISFSEYLLSCSTKMSWEFILQNDYFFLIGISRRIQFEQFLVNKGNINKEKKVITVFEISSLSSYAKWSYTRYDL